MPSLDLPHLDAGMRTFDEITDFSSFDITFQYIHQNAWTYETYREVCRERRQVLAGGTWANGPKLEGL